MYLINQSLTYTIFHSEHAPVHNAQLALVNEYLDHVIYKIIKIIL
jgi:hypothetical protein